jgi:prolyl 4-hydroxylase
MLLPPDLKKYIEKLHAGGKNFTQIVVNLAVTGGFAIHFAQRLVETALEGSGDNLHLMDDADLLGGPMPRIDTSMENTTLNLPDRAVRVVMEQWAPRVVLLDDLLSDEECDAICRLASASLTAGFVHDSEQVQPVRQDDTRKVDVANADLQRDPLLAKIESRIEALTGWPRERGEPMLVQRYGEEGKFKEHFDFFLEETEYYEKAIEHGGQRVATLIIYLQKPERGGATYMANLGLRVVPNKGSALFFTYPTPSTQSGTLHAGDPVLAGEKWIMTKWFRQSMYAQHAATAAAP